MSQSLSQAETGHSSLSFSPSQVLEEEMETLRIKESLRSYPEISQPLSNPHDPGGRTVPQVYGVGCSDFYFFFLLPGMSSYCVFV